MGDNEDKWTAAVTVRLIITVLMVIIVGFWLIMVAQRLATAPVTGSDGTVIYDEFARSKDILIAVLPLLTLALGYWFGAQSADKADQKAEKADQKAQATEAEKSTLDAQVKAFYKVADRTLIDEAEAEMRAVQ